MPVDEAQRRDILCIQEERVVAPDNTVATNGRHLRIRKDPARAHFVRAKLRVREYPDGNAPFFTARAASPAGATARRPGVPSFRAAGLWTASTSCACPPRPQDDRNNSGPLCVLHKPAKFTCQLQCGPGVDAGRAKGLTQADLAGAIAAASC
ncbi:MAG: hypothetical protein L0Y57_05365 [Beijerinckiaceae bacterium]|nr:hypothetical protein [Beijerinckiaceae bacterium]